MKAEAIRKVNEKVARRYPKLLGVSPKVSAHPTDSYLLIYSYRDALPNGNSICHTIRVVADEDGKISKMSSSRG